MGIVIYLNGGSRRHDATSLMPTIPQREAGAEKPRRRKAPVSTRKVREGKEPEDFQLETALYSAPVRSETAPRPPRTEMTSADVESSRSMGTDIIQNIWMRKPPNLIDGIQKSWMRQCSPMSKRHPLGKNSPLAQRLRLLQEVVSGPVAAEFARKMGISPGRWHNPVNGHPLSTGLEAILIEKIPGLSPGWLRSGTTGDLSVDMARRLGALPPAPPPPPPNPEQRVQKKAVR